MQQAQPAPRAGLRAAAHRLKGTFGSLAADHAAALAARLECLGRDGDLENAPRELENLKREAERVDAELRALRKAAPPRTTP